MKRFLSVFIAALLVLTMLPAGIASAEPSGWDEFTSYSYVFKSSAFNSTAQLTPTKGTHSIEAIKALNAAGTDTGSDPWGFLYSAGQASVVIETVGFRHSSYLNMEGDVNAQGANDGHVAIYDPSLAASQRFLLLEIDVAEAGTFRPVATAVGAKTNAKFDVYLISQEGKTAPANATAAAELIRYCGEENRLGTADFYSATSGEVEVSFPKRSLEAGRYWLAFVYNGSNPGCVFSYQSTEGHKYYGYYYSYNKISGFRLDGMANTTEPVELEYVFKSTSLNIGTIADGNAGTTPDDHVPYIGADHTSNDNRYGYGWVGSDENSPFIRNYEVVLTTQYHNPEATDPWTGFFASGKDEPHYNFNNDYIDKNGIFGNARAGAGNLTTDGTLVNASTGVSTGKAATDNFTGPSAYPFYTFELQVPYTGVYTVSAQGGKYAAGAVANIYLLHESKLGSATGMSKTIYQSQAPIGQYSFYDASLKNTGKAYSTVYIEGYDYETVATDVRLESSGKYYLVVEYTPNADQTRWQNDDNQLYYMGLLSSVKLVKTGEAESSLDAEYEEEIEVDTETAVPEDYEEESVTVSAIASDVEGNSVEATITSSGNAVVGGEYTVTAPEVEGYSFLYWAKGLGKNKRFVSAENEYTTKLTAGRNLLTAVYRADTSEKTLVVFYNGNREEISRSLYNTGDEITVPAFPAMAGFGAAEGWALAGDDTSYEAGDTVIAEGETMTFVAQYGDVYDVAVTTTATVSNPAPAYGEEVTVTATLRDATGENIFAYWEKDGEIVSFDREYTFTAWKDNTVITPVYKKYQTTAETIRKIILSSFTVGEENAVMAEFLLPGVSVVEKGVIFGSDLKTAPYRAAMSGSGDYFSVIDDVSEAPVGYAILTDGTVIYSK